MGYREIAKRSFEKLADPKLLGGVARVAGGIAAIAAIGSELAERLRDQREEGSTTNRLATFGVLAASIAGVTGAIDSMRGGATTRRNPDMGDGEPLIVDAEIVEG